MPSNFVRVVPLALPVTDKIESKGIRKRYTPKGKLNGLMTERYSNRGTDKITKYFHSL